MGDISKLSKGAWSAMTFQQLEYVVEISKCGSINKAAQKLFLSQSGISTAVRELEGELGITLLTRSNRGVEFTPEGKEFLSYAVSLLEQKRQIEGLYGEARNSAAPVRFSVSSQRLSLCVGRLFAAASDGGGKPLPLWDAGDRDGRRHRRRL